MQFIWNIIKKPVYLNNDDYNFSKRHCIYSMIFVGFHFALYCLVLYVLTKTSLYSDVLEGGYTPFRKFMTGGILFLSLALPIIFFMIFTKQSLHSIGLRKKGLLSSFIVTSPFAFLLYLRFVQNGQVGFDLLFNSLFYIIFVGFEEELIFRGFIWPRAQVLFGNLRGFIITGLLFGLYHSPFFIIWYDYGILDALFGGNVSLFGGIMSHLIFAYLYTRNDNLLLPALIHGLLDLSSSLE